jgi:hypothetical protein
VSDHADRLNDNGPHWKLVCSFYLVSYSYCTELEAISWLFIFGTFDTLFALHQAVMNKFFLALTQATMYKKNFVGVQVFEKELREKVDANAYAYTYERP